MLSGHAVQDADGTLVVTGTDAPESLSITDLGDGTILVEYRVLNDPNSTPKFDRFFFVPKVEVDLKAGDDEFRYASDNLVGAALSELDVLLGDGNDDADVQTVSRPNPSGDGTEVQFFSVEIDGANGNDAINALLTTESGVGRAEHDLTTIGGDGDDTINVAVTNGFPVQNFRWFADGTTGFDRIDGRIAGTGLFESARVEMHNAQVARLRVDVDMLDMEAALQSDPNTTNSDSGCLIWDFVGAEVAQLEIDGTDGRDEVDIQVTGEGFSVLTVDLNTGGGGDSVNVRQDRSLSWVVQQDWNIDLGDATDELNFRDTVADDGGTPAVDELTLNVLSAEILRLNHQSPVGDLIVQADASSGRVAVPGFGNFTISPRKAQAEMAGFDNVQIAAIAQEPAAGRQRNVRSHDFLVMSTASVNTNYTKFSLSGVPLRSVAAVLETDPLRVDANTRMRTRIDVAQTEGLEMVIEQLERGDVRARGFGFVNVSAANDDQSFGYSYRAADDGVNSSSALNQQHTRFNGSILAMEADQTGDGAFDFAVQGFKTTNVSLTNSDSLATFHGEATGDLGTPELLLSSAVRNGLTALQLSAAAFDEADYGLSGGGPATVETGIVIPAFQDYTARSTYPGGPFSVFGSHSLNEDGELVSAFAAAGFSEMTFDSVVTHPAAPGAALATRASATRAEGDATPILYNMLVNNENVESEIRGASAFHSVLDDGRTLRAALSGESQIDPENRYRVKIAYPWASPALDLRLAGYDDADADVTFFDGRVLSAADLNLEAVEVPNLTLTVSAADAHVEPVRIVKAAVPHDPATYDSKLQFGMANWLSTYRLIEQNVSSFAFQADLPQHQIEKDFLMPVEDVFSIQGAYGPDTIDIVAEDFSGAVQSSVRIAGTDPSTGPSLALNLSTAAPNRNGRAGRWQYTYTVDNQGPVASGGVAVFSFDGLAIDNADLNASGIAAMRRSLSNVEIVGSYAESIRVERDLDQDVRLSRPLIISEDGVQVDPGASFQSNVLGAGHVVRRTENLTLGEGSSYFRSISAQDPATADEDKRKQSLYFPEEMLKDVQIEPGASLVSETIGGDGDDFLVRRWVNVVNREGTMRTLTDTGDGADTAIKFVTGWGAAQYQYGFEGTYNFGGGSDLFVLRATDVNVPTGASFATTVRGGTGRDVIEADVNATVDGSYTFLARGGRGADRISVFHEIAGTRASESNDPPPEIRLLIHGGGGNDVLAGWLVARDVDEERIFALINGGRGDDVCAGNIPAVNCEQ